MQFSFENECVRWMRRDRCGTDVGPFWGRFWSHFGPFWGRFWSHFGCQNGPKSSLEAISLPTSILDRFRTENEAGPRILGPLWAASWRPLGGFLGVKLGSSWSQNRFLEVLDGVQTRTWFLIPFRTDFDPILEPSGGRKWSQNRSAIGIKNDHEAKAKIFQKHCVFTVKMASRKDRKSIKNRSKSYLKTVWSWGTKRSCKSSSKCPQHGS